METSDNWVGLEHLIHEKMRIVLHFTGNESCCFLFLKCHLCPMSIRVLSPSLPPPSLPLLSPLPVLLLLLLILDLDRSQATYGDETAECVLETPQH